MNRTSNFGHRKPSHFWTFTLAAVTIAIFTMCQQQAGEENDQEAQAETAAQTYRAELTPLNENVTEMQTSGTATLTIEGDSLTISVEVQNAPPSIMHLQHFHGFIGDTTATCASMEQDTTNDSIVDLLETYPVSGITLVPFHQNPASLEIAAETYPVADSTGSYTYQQTVSVSDLQQALKQQHDIDSLYLDRRVVYIHSVSEQTQLPESVQSLEGVPAQVTLPIACGKLERVE